MPGSCSGFHFTSCAIAPWINATLSVASFGVVHAREPASAPTTAIATSTAAAPVAAAAPTRAGARPRLVSATQTASVTSAPATASTAQLMPCKPSSGAYPISHESVWLYPADSQPKPVNSQPRVHSVSTNSAGSVTSHAAAPLVRNQRAAMKPAAPTNAASTSVKPTVSPTASAIGAPPMSCTAM
jgi:hypothetical protein